MKLDFLKSFNVFKQYSAKTLLIHFLLIVVVGIVVVLLFFNSLLPAITHSGETLTVPNLEGMNYEQLEDFLGKRGLNYEATPDSAYSSVYEPLTVIKQYPESDALVKSGRKIYVTLVAKEPQKVKIPKEMVGRSLKNAELILKSYGLKRGSITYKPDLAQNVVLEVWSNGEKLEPLDEVAKGSVIDFIVGDGYGKRNFTLGNYVGRDIEDVKFAINGQGLSLGAVIIEVIDEDTYLEIDLLDLDSLKINESGMVIKQIPQAGSNVRLGDIVDLWIGALNRADSIDLLKQKSGEDIEEDELN
mgnify:CR=1 FL=1